MKKLALSVIICELIGILSTPFTVEAIPTWYAMLNKPSFSPPNWVFGPVWTLLYALMGVSLYIIWNSYTKKKGYRNAMNVFIIQLGLNFFWSILFFGLRSPLLGLIDITLMWVFIVLTIVAFGKLSKTAAYLLIPYLFWVSFASVLNAAILLLN